MSCTTVTDFPEGRCNVPGLRMSNPNRPADDPGPSGAWSSSSATSEATACNTHPSSCSKRHLFHGGLEGSVLLRQIVLLVHVVRPVFRLSVSFFVGNTDATFSVIQQMVEFSQPRPYSFFLPSRCRRRVPGCVRGALCLQRCPWRLVHNS